MVGFEGAHARRSDFDLAAGGQLLEADVEGPVAVLDAVAHGRGQRADATFDARRPRDLERAFALVLVERAEQVQRDAAEMIGVEVRDQDGVDLVA